MASNKQTKNRLPALMIDFSKSPIENVVYPLTPATMARAIQERLVSLGGDRASIRWDAEAVRAVNTQLRLYDDIPSRCKGCIPLDGKDPDDPDSGVCPRRRDCPFPPEKVEEEYKGLNCPDEVVTAFKIFVGFIVDLGIDPDDYTDLQMVVDLVRLHLLMRKCDLYQKDLPIHEKKVAGIYQKTGEARYDKAPNLGYQMQREIRDQIDKRYEQLIASRKAKAQRDKDVGRQQQNAITIWDAIRKAGEKLNQKAEEDKNGSVIDAEYTEGDSKPNG